MQKMLHNLVEKFTENRETVIEWVEDKRAETPLPPYASCDIRNSGFKLTQVDTNLFPAGWNNLCPSYKKKASSHFAEYFAANYAEVESIAVLTEDHTRNTFYFSNLLALQTILVEAGFEVKLVNPVVEEVSEFETAEGETLVLHPMSELSSADLVLLNNDLSSGEVELGFDGPVLPSLDLGWHTRRKSEHFAEFNSLVEEFAEIIGFDAWHMRTEFVAVDDVDVNQEADRQKLAEAVDGLLDKIRKEYAERGIESDPVVFVKNDSGTYGMGVISVRSGQEIIDLNRKNRNKLSVGKSGMQISNFLVQEGVPTVDKIKGNTAEPVAYIAGGRTAGGFFRVNDQKDANDNLNSRGMKFVKLCFDKVLD
jgi:glutamate--cysteine ligase